MLKISDLQAKDIVNMANGKRLGHLTDLEINLETGTIEALIIDGGGKMMGLFGKESEEVFIPWKNIIRIGADVILVEVHSPFMKKSAPIQQRPTFKKQ